MKSVGEWASKVEIRTSKKLQAAGEACMAVFWPTPRFKGKTFTVPCPQQRDLNFCICITPIAEVLLEFSYVFVLFFTRFYSSFRNKHTETLDITNMHVLGKNKEEEKKNGTMSIYS